MFRGIESLLFARCNGFKLAMESPVCSRCRILCQDGKDWFCSVLAERSHSVHYYSRPSDIIMISRRQISSKVYCQRSSEWIKELLISRVHKSSVVLNSCVNKKIWCSERSVTTIQPFSSVSYKSQLFVDANLLDIQLFFNRGISGIHSQTPNTSVLFSQNRQFSDSVQAPSCLPTCCCIAFGKSRGFREPIKTSSCWSKQFVRWKSDKEIYPPLNDADLEEQFTRGSGPGGQNVNKLSNCVVLKHKPTGVFVKCHESRLLDTNRKLARLRLQQRLDWHYNREDSIVQQERKMASEKRKEQKRRTNAKLEKLKAFKEREGIP